MVGDHGTLLDHLGRRSILDSCQKLSGGRLRAKLETELRDAMMGRSHWFLRDEENGGGDAGDGMRHLHMARGKKPLSLFDWKIWTMAKPRLWRYGDAGNLFDREEVFSTSEWAACFLLREDTFDHFDFL